MRTTLTLDDDLAVILKRLAESTGRPFKDVVNEAIRVGLQAGEPAAAPLRQPREMGGFLVDVTQALSVLDALDDARLVAELGSGGSGGPGSA